MEGKHRETQRRTKLCVLLPRSLSKTFNLQLSTFVASKVPHEEEITVYTGKSFWGGLVYSNHASSVAPR